MDIDEAYPDQVAFGDALQVRDATRSSSVAHARPGPRQRGAQDGPLQTRHGRRLLHPPIHPPQDPHTAHREAQRAQGNGQDSTAETRSVVPADDAAVPRHHGAGCAAPRGTVPRQLDDGAGEDDGRVQVAVPGCATAALGLQIRRRSPTR